MDDDTAKQITCMVCVTIISTVFMYCCAVNKK